MYNDLLIHGELEERVKLRDFGSIVLILLMKTMSKYLKSEVFGFNSLVTHVVCKTYIPCFLAFFPKMKSESNNLLSSMA